MCIVYFCLTSHTKMFPSLRIKIYTFHEWFLFNQDDDDDDLIFWWRFWCLAKWSLLINAFWHTEQTCFFSPVCVRRCRLNSSDRANVLLQSAQEHENGFSPKQNKKKDIIIKSTKSIFSYIRRSFYPLYCYRVCECVFRPIEERKRK